MSLYAFGAQMQNGKDQEALYDGAVGLCNIYASMIYNMVRDILQNNFGILLEWFRWIVSLFVGNHWKFAVTKKTDPIFFYFSFWIEAVILCIYEAVILYYMLSIDLILEVKSFHSWYQALLH